MGRAAGAAAEAVAARRALSRAGSSITGELAVLAMLAEGAAEPVAEGPAGRGAAQRGASLARSCASCERAEDLGATLREGGGLPDGASVHLDGLLADADRALREAERCARPSGATSRHRGLRPGGPIDKVPFTVPDDPVNKALARRAGPDWFRLVSLPAAQMALRQGAGRLIRSASDRGVLALLDPRVSARPWGRRIVSSLPPAPATDSTDRVRAFFAG